jgi:nucleotide-binding universal stress UspA family protein
MHKLLVPIDGSDSSMRALNYAIKLAQAHPTFALHLLTVHPEPIVYGEIQVYVSREKMEEMQLAHCLDILQPAIEATKAAGVPYASEVLVGETAQIIAKRAHELNCDAIVMGTRGMSAIANLVMGSVATKVLHLTKLPVTLVH